MGPAAIASHHEALLAQDRNTVHRLTRAAEEGSSFGSREEFRPTYHQFRESCTPLHSSIASRLDLQRSSCVCGICVRVFEHPVCVFGASLCHTTFLESCGCFSFDWVAWTCIRPVSQMCKAQQEKFEKLSEEVVHMSIVLGDDSDADLAEWRDLESCLTDERLQAFKDKKMELNKATVSCS